MARVLITGGAGFIGSHLCERFLGEGDDVICIDNFRTSTPDNIAHLFANKRFMFIEQDVTTYIYVKGPVDFILHFASPASPVDYMEFPIPTLKVGSLGTHKALGLAKEKSARLLIASTSEVYGDPLVHPQNEEYWGNVNPIGPRGVYDEAKRFAEALTMAYHRAHGVDTRIVRIFNTHGPRMRLNDGRVVPNFISQAFRGEPMTVYGDGSQTRSFCYVSDLVEGIVRLLRSDYNLPVNVGNPREVSILQFADTIKTLTGSKSEIVFRPLPPDDPKVRQPDISRAKKLLGWEPRVGLEEGLRHTIDYFRQKYLPGRMKILVSGGAGFIGSHVVDAYVAAGHDVIVVDNLSTGHRENLNPRARFHQLDIQDGRAAELIRDERPDVLNHHAAQMDVRRSVADPLFDARTNILGTVALLEAARAAGVRRVLFVSSGGAVYGEQEGFPATESHPTNPVSPYGVSKRAGELYAFFYQAAYGIPFLALRYANVYGPRQDPHGEAGVVAIFTGRMLRGEPVTVNGDGSQSRDYVFVGDVARANLLALESKQSGPVNIGTGVETDVNALARLLLEATGGRSEVRHGPAKTGEQRRSVVDARRAGDWLGWRPEVSLAEGLRRTAEWFRGNTRSTT